MRNNLACAVLAFAIVVVGCDGQSQDVGPDAGNLIDAAGAGRDASTSDAAASAADAGARDGGAGSADGGSAQPRRVGEACAADGDCPAGGSGTATCLSDWPGGYCAVVGCAQHGHDCPEDPGLGGIATAGWSCVLATEASCLALCAGDADCRPEYQCASKPDAAGHGTTEVCVPRAT